MKRFLIFISCCLILSLLSPIPAFSKDLDLACKSAILMEQSTGTILYKKDAHKKLRPASITKVMTLLLIFEALDEGRIKLDDVVTTSEHAASMGGSNVFLEANEQQTVETMIKCICISSANDAAVAMAEHLSGSEDAFVDEMNKRAKELSMKDTTYKNACGLDADGHVSSAYDIAILSRYLLMHHPKVLDYTKIWMDSFEHVTRRGKSTFQLSNTNKLIKQYPYATGLKTGSTSLAKFSLSASASKDDLDLICVVMAAPDFKERFSCARKLLDYGFANVKVFTPKKPVIPNIHVEKGDESSLALYCKEQISLVGTKDHSAKDYISKIDIPKSLTAPIRKNTKIGCINYYLKDKKVGSINLYAANTIKVRTYPACIKRFLSYLIPF